MYEFFPTHWLTGIYVLFFFNTSRQDGSTPTPEGGHPPRHSQPLRALRPMVVGSPSSAAVGPCSRQRQQAGTDAAAAATAGVLPLAAAAGVRWLAAEGDTGAAGGYSRQRLSGLYLFFGLYLAVFPGLVCWWPAKAASSLPVPPSKAASQRTPAAKPASGSTPATAAANAAPAPACCRCRCARARLPRRRRPAAHSPCVLASGIVWGGGLLRGWGCCRLAVKC